MKYSTRIRYLFDSALKMATGKGFQCPSCGSAESSPIDSKYLVTQLRRCEGCRLLFRAPTTSSEDARQFYQESYSEGFTTKLPSNEEIRSLISCEFKGTEKDYSAYIDAMRALAIAPDARVLDFGCSWGYGTWQLRNAGFRVQGFEISQPRCRFARDVLQVDARSAWEDIHGPFDVVFSAHVLEHIPGVSGSLRRMWEQLADGGTLLAFTPNGSLIHRSFASQAWHQAWGYVHPNLIDEEFYKHHFRNAPLLLASTPYPYQIIERWGGADNGRIDVTECNLSGAELMAAALKRGPVAS